jgi:hypothetical protein
VDRARAHVSDPPLCSALREARRGRGAVFHTGRTWILDEYLIDVTDIGASVAALEGDRRPLGDVIRELGLGWLAGRVAYWHDAPPAEIQMAKAHVEDLAVAAEAMALEVPMGEPARLRIAVDVAALLMRC